MKNTIKKDLSKEIKKTIEILKLEFPLMSPYFDNVEFKEASRRKDTRVEFQAQWPIPLTFVDTLFKQLFLCVTIRLQTPENNPYHDKDFNYYWIQVAWAYEHPSGGTNGHSFCDITLKFSGEQIAVRTEKQKEVAGCL